MKIRIVTSPKPRHIIYRGRWTRIKQKIADLMTSPSTRSGGWLAVPGSHNFNAQEAFAFSNALRAMCRYRNSRVSISCYRSYDDNKLIIKKR